MATIARHFTAWTPVRPDDLRSEKCVKSSLMTLVVHSPWTRRVYPSPRDDETSRSDKRRKQNSGSLCGTGKERGVEPIVLARGS